MPKLNWGMINDGGALESLMHSVLYAKYPDILLFGRPGKDSGQDARSSDGKVIYQSKYRQSNNMDEAVGLALGELKKIKLYKQLGHSNYIHWEKAESWILVTNIEANPLDVQKWKDDVVPAFAAEKLQANFWGIEKLESELLNYSYLTDVFFGSKNRILLGLRESFDLLSQNSTAEAMTNPLVGFENELKLVEAFSHSDEKRLAPIIASQGGGKSRFLYESLVLLSTRGWRVLWGLSSSMLRSEQWFALLNDNRKTVVAVDDLENPELFKTILEQLSPIERRNWKFITSTGIESSAPLKRFALSSFVLQEIKLPHLNEAQSGAFIKGYLGKDPGLPWLHSVYKYSKGIPGWLYIIAKLFHQGDLRSLPNALDSISRIYVDKCLGALPSAAKPAAKKCLQWLSLAGAVNLEDPESNEWLALFTEESIPQNILDDLVSCGLVRNWGVKKRYFAIEPAIIRHQVLIDWLFRSEKSKFHINNDGELLIKRLIDGRVPDEADVLRNLAILQRNRILESDSEPVMGPIFDHLEELIGESDTQVQYRILELVTKIGISDPDKALEAFVALRRHPKPSISIDRLWGPVSYSHEELVSRIPWELFQVAEAIEDENTAARYIEEFKELIDLQPRFENEDRSKRADALLARLLNQSKNSGIFFTPATDILKSEITVEKHPKFLRIAAIALLNPEKEAMQWVSNGAVSFTRRIFNATSPQWLKIKELRDLLFSALSPLKDYSLVIWDVLSESHHAMHRLILHRRLQGADAASFHEILRLDLAQCAATLDAHKGSLTIEHGTRARALWSWYLEHSDDVDLKNLARKCEDVYESISHWRLHDFYRFDTEDNLRPATDYVVAQFQKAERIEDIEGFFNESQRYLATERKGGQDLADSMRIADLADKTYRLVELGPPPHSTLTQFFRKALNSGPSAGMPWAYAIGIAKKFIRDAERPRRIDQIKYFLSLTEAKTELLKAFYSNPHPATVEELTVDEYHIFSGFNAQLSQTDLFWLNGAFAIPAWEEVSKFLAPKLAQESTRGAHSNIDPLLTSFVDALYLFSLRYRASIPLVIIQWIVDQINQFELDGDILGNRSLLWLVDKSGYKMSLADFLNLLKARIKIETSNTPRPARKVLPFEFSATKWTQPYSQGIDDAAFFEICNLVFEKGYIAYREVPRIINDLDESGLGLEQFVITFLKEQKAPSIDQLTTIGNLVSWRQEDSPSWSACARLLCAKVNRLPQKQREDVYFSLTEKETGVMTTAIGEVAEYYTQKADSAKAAASNEPNNSPLSEYRKWKLRRAEAELAHEEQVAEEERES